MAKFVIYDLTPTETVTMDTNIKIKEENPFSDDVVSKNETEFFTKNVVMKTNGDAVLVDSDRNMAIKTEIKSEAPYPNFPAQKETESFTKHHVKQIKSQTVKYSSYCGIDITTGRGSQNRGVFLPEDPAIMVKTYNSDHEIDKVEIKEEPWWLESETSFVCGDSKVEEFAPVKSQRLSTEAGSGDSCGVSPLPIIEPSEKNKRFVYGKDSPDRENQDSGNTKMPDVEKHVCLEQCNNGNTCSCSLMWNKGKRSYKCSICDESFTQLAAFKLHNLMHKGKKPYKCEICEKSFVHFSALKIHNTVHVDKRPHICQICKKSFKWLSNLQDHNLIHEGKRPHKCAICEKRFTRFSDLKQHNLIHEGKKLYRCKICEKSYTRLSHLKKHKFIHDGRKPHKCEICERSFTNVSSMKRHITMHVGIRSHKCEICEKSFAQLCHLKQHNLIHEGKKPYKCEICEKRFTQLSALKRHHMIHEGKRPYKCEMCEKSFRWLSNLKRHKLIHSVKGLTSVEFV